MFGSAKPNFGSTTTGAGFGSFSNVTTSSPFAQSAFGKPTTSSFGVTSTFGGQQTTSSLFGASPAQPQATSLFAGASNSSAFGSTASNTQPSFGGFFGSSQPATNTTSLFNQSATNSAFGSAIKPGGFGQTVTQPTTSLFGQNTTSTGGFVNFGQPAASTTNVFGGGQTTAFGQNANATANPGTSIAKYQATIGTDTLMKSGQPNNVSTKQHCITTMKEYEHKSLEELRMEDYLANRKGPQTGTAVTSGFGLTTATSTGMFGTTTQPTTGLFGQPSTSTIDNKGLFGTTIGAFGQQTTNTFGTTTNQPQNNFLAKPFSSATTTGFGSVSTDANNPFGAKPAFSLTAASSLFGQNSTANTTSAFGQPTTGFGGFGNTQGIQSQQPSLFGQTNSDANKTNFGLGTASVTNTGFGGFGNTITNTSNTGVGLFGTKQSGFGTGSAFGTPSTVSSAFGNFSLNNTNTVTSPFNSALNKPPTSGFSGFGPQTSTAMPLNFNSGSTGTGLFGNNANKAGGGLFGGGIGNNANNSIGGLFGNTGMGVFGNNNTLGGAFGTNTLGGVNSNFNNMLNTQQQQVPIHQQILSKVTSPYGENTIFKDLKRNDENDATRATNPAAQKVILESTGTAGTQFKISTKNSPSIVKVKPMTVALTKKCLFDGLEELDVNVELFNLKPNVKRLILKTKSNNYQNTSSVSGLGLEKNSSVDSSPNNNNKTFNSQSQTKFVSNNGGAEQSVGGIAKEDVNNSDDANYQIDSSRRESWLHPKNLEKVRQQNLNNNIDTNISHNNTLNELVPRKPLETYCSPSIGKKIDRFDPNENNISVKTNSETSLIDQSSTSILCREEVSHNNNDTIGSNRCEETSVVISEDSQNEYEDHPTGIVLRRVGYYTIPSMDELKSYLAEDGSCIVPNFTVGREGYGNVYFGSEIDVAGLNLDEIVHFRNKEVIIYPDDENKPPIGQQLNRDAQITLDQVWPLDKNKHEPIKNSQQLAEMDWEGRLRRVCNKNGTRFVEYRPETGSWVFRVKHFSKYGLTDSDEEEINAVGAKKAKMSTTVITGNQNLSNDKNINGGATEMLMNSNNTKTLDQQENNTILNHLEEPRDFTLTSKSQYFHGNTDVSIFEKSQVQLRSEPVSPTASLARDIGTDAHKLQLMKASLFNDRQINFDKENQESISYAGEMVLKKKLSDLYNTSPKILPRKNLVCRASTNNAEMSLSETSSCMDYMLQSNSLFLMPDSSDVSNRNDPEKCNNLESTKSMQKLPSFVFKPKIAPVQQIIVQIPFSRSLAYSKRLHWMSDLGIYYSHRFKLTFGLQNTVILPTTYNNVDREMKSINYNMIDIVPQIFKKRSADDFSATVLQKVKISSLLYYENFKDSIVEHLQIQLNNSQKNDVLGSECPFFTADRGSNLIVQHLEESIKLLHLGSLEEYAVSVWSLCLALWGDHEELEGRDATSHYVVMYRRNLLSEWLENTLADKNFSNSVSKYTYLEQLIKLVMCHKVTEACELAFSHDDINLSLLLAQLSGGPTVRQLMEDQLASWYAVEADKFIDVERLKLYMLVGGIGIMSSSYGVINPLEGIEWIKVLAIQLWYMCSPISSITDALLAYEKCFRSNEFYSRAPLPSYMEDGTYHCNSTTVYDMRYHLLHLYSKRSYPLESLINPATHTPDSMDYRLSWLILQTLDALGYCHCSELSKAQLHVGFATQLESNNLWEWAIFVLLHINDRNQRELAIQNILYRYVTVSAEESLTEKERFVINKLGVPEKWIDYAKAVKAASLGDYNLQANYLIKAKQWSLAHEIIFNHIAPEAIINDNLEYLYQLLSQFETPDMSQNSIKVPNWSIQGQIFLDYIDIKDKFKNLKMLKTDADIEARWENLKPQLADLCSRINLLPCPTSRHRLAQSEIAQNLAYLIRGVLIVCPSLNPCLIIKVALERLPLPQEFAQQELRLLLDALVNDLERAQRNRNAGTSSVAIKLAIT